LLFLRRKIAGEVPIMKKSILVLVSVGSLVLGLGFELRADAGLVSREEVLFMEIPTVVITSKKTGSLDNLIKAKENSWNKLGGKK
jgi:hypothetical protein